MGTNPSVARLLLSAAALLGALACGSSNGGGGPPPGSGIRHTWVIPDTAAALEATGRAAFGAGTLYANAHTSANTGGEVRGQLDKAGSLRLATLDGAQETPAVSTTAFGAGALTVDQVTGAVRGFVVTSGLTDATAAHVHTGARGVAGGILVPLTGGPEVWVVPDDAPNLTAAQISDFSAGLLYFNVHTGANPNGEIRGQIDRSGTARVAALDGAQETPSVSTTAFGGGVLVVDANGRPGGFVVSSGLTSTTAAHVHTNARGVAGGVTVPLAGGPSLWVIPDTAAAVPGLLASFDAGLLYYNVHTSANPAGEIRGQIDRSGNVRLATLTGGQEVPAVSTSAFGAGLVAVDDGVSGELGGFLVTYGLTSPTAAHVHGAAARGVNAGVLVPFAGP